MLEKIKIIRDEFSDRVQKISNLEQLEQLRIEFLGRKGKISNAFSLLSEVPAEIKPQFGQGLNKLKKEAESRYQELAEKLSLKKSTAPKLDLSLPGRRIHTGHRHPLTLVGNEIKSIFRSLGFSIEDGPEIETDFYNFEALNIPESHPVPLLSSPSRLHLTQRS